MRFIIDGYLGVIRKPTLCKLGLLKVDYAGDPDKMQIVISGPELPSKGDATG